MQWVVDSLQCILFLNLLHFLWWCLDETVSGIYMYMYNDKEANPHFRAGLKTPKNSSQNQWVWRTTLPSHTKIEENKVTDCFLSILSPYLGWLLMKWACLEASIYRVTGVPCHFSHILNERAGLDQYIGLFFVLGGRKDWPLPPTQNRKEEYILVQ